MKLRLVFRLARILVHLCAGLAACALVFPWVGTGRRNALIQRWSRRLLAPRPVFSVASIIPMIPGSYAFKAMIAIVELNISGVTMELIQSAVENGLKAIFIVGALSFGLAIPSLVVYRNRPII